MASENSENDDPRGSQYLAELDAALKSIETNAGYSAERVFRWMHSWGTAAELPVPVPDVAPLKEPEH